MRYENIRYKVLGLIPARWGSTRFEGKPLADIGGKKMIHRVYDQCKKTENLEEVIVLTDDDRIEDYCVENKINVLRVDDDCETGTDRCAIASNKLSADIFVNIQGDEPLIEPDTIDAVVDAHNHHIGVTNAYCDIVEEYKLEDRNVCKVALDTKGNAQYYSRLPISEYQQLGLYAFSGTSLEDFYHLTKGECEKRERIEMLRFIENDMNVKMVKVEEESISVDVPSDIKLVEEKL